MLGRAYNDSVLRRVRPTTAPLLPLIMSSETDLCAACRSLCAAHRRSRSSSRVSVCVSLFYIPLLELNAHALARARGAAIGATRRLPSFLPPLLFLPDPASLPPSV